MSVFEELLNTPNETINFAPATSDDCNSHRLFFWLYFSLFVKEFMLIRLMKNSDLLDA